jgi:OmpA-OmpF porin, OOP family
MKAHKRVMIAALVGVATASVAPSALAQYRGQAGWYAGVSLGQSEVEIEGCGGAVSCDEKDTAWRVLGGYQFNQNFAAELGFHQLGDASASGPGGSVEFETNAFELVGVGAFPLGAQFSVYGKAGFYRGETKVTGSVLGVPVDIKETNTDLTYGVGVQYHINRQIGVRAEWQRYTNMGDSATIGESDVDVMSIGLVFRF